MRTIVLFLGGLALACLVLRWLSPDREIVTQVVIDAPPERVWSILADGTAYSEWNPFIIRLDGAFVAGRPVSILLRSGETDSLAISPTVTVVDPHRQLRWLGRLPVPGLFDGEHYFLLSPVADGRTHFVHGERFRGVLPWLLGVERYRRNFETMNRALARRAESGAADFNRSDR